MVTLNKDLKNNRNTEPTQCKMTEEGKIVSNEFLEVDFSLSLQCGGLYIYILVLIQGKKYCIYH